MHALLDLIVHLYPQKWNSGAQDYTMCGPDWALVLKHTISHWHSSNSPFRHFCSYFVLPTLGLKQLDPFLLISTNITWLGFKVKSMQLQSSIFSLPKPLPATVRVTSRFTAPTSTDPNSMASSGPKWAQKTITLPPQNRGCHLITPKVGSLLYLKT